MCCEPRISSEASRVVSCIAQRSTSRKGGYASFETHSLDRGRAGCHRSCDCGDRRRLLRRRQRARVLTDLLPRPRFGGGRVPRSPRPGVGCRTGPARSGHDARTWVDRGRWTRKGDAPERVSEAPERFDERPVHRAEHRRRRQRCREHRHQTVRVADEEGVLLFEVLRR